MPAALEGIVCTVSEMECAHVCPARRSKAHWESDDLTIGETGELVHHRGGGLRGAGAGHRLLLSAAMNGCMHIATSTPGELPDPAALTRRAVHIASTRPESTITSGTTPNVGRVPRDERDTNTVSGYGGAVHLIAGGEICTGSGRIQRPLGGCSGWRDGAHRADWARLAPQDRSGDRLGRARAPIVSRVPGAARLHVPLGGGRRPSRPWHSAVLTPARPARPTTWSDDPCRRRLDGGVAAPQFPPRRAARLERRGPRSTGGRRAARRRPW